MASPKRRPFRSVVTSQTVIISLLAILVGVGLLYVAGRDDWWRHRATLQSVVSSFAGFLIVSAGLGLLWDLRGRRAFTEEILEVAQTTTDVRAAGLVRIGANYAEEPDWATMFAGVSKLDIFVAYAQTWRNIHYTKLQAVARKSSARIRVFLPDPGDTQTITRLANRFGKTAQELTNLIVEATRAYYGLETAGGAAIEVYYRPGDALFSCYRFDANAVLTLYTHQRARIGVPTIVCRYGGTLYQFVRDELKAIQAQSTLVDKSAIGGHP